MLINHFTSDKYNDFDKAHKDYLQDRFETVDLGPRDEIMKECYRNECLSNTSDLAAHAYRLKDPESWVVVKTCRSRCVIQ